MSDKVVAGGDVIGLVMSDPGTEPQGTSGPSFSILKLHSMGGFWNLVSHATSFFN